MKNIIRFIAIAGLSVSLAACNKAEFVDEDFVTFTSDRYSATEDAGILKVPVRLYGDGECVVTYSVMEGTAKEGINYEVVDRNGNPDKTGVLTVIGRSEPEDNCIYIKLTDKTGEDTGNLKFSISLNATAEDGIGIGAFSKCECTIIDNDGGLSKLIGSYVGKGTDEDGKPVDFTFVLDEYDPATDPAAKYPKANFMLTDGVMNFANGNNMTFNVPLYGRYDENMAQLHVFGLQPFNTYNFGDPVGVCDVAWGIDAASEAELANDIIIEPGEGTLELPSTILLWLLDHETGKPNLYTAGSLGAGYIWTKK